MNRVELLSEAYESPVLTVELHRRMKSKMGRFPNFTFSLNDVDARKYIGE